MKVGFTMPNIDVDIFNNERGCEECINSRWIVSENGYKSICTLSAAKMMACITGRENHKKVIKPASDYKESE